MNRSTPRTRSRPALAVALVAILGVASLAAAGSAPAPAGGEPPGDPVSVAIAEAEAALLAAKLAAASGDAESAAAALALAQDALANATAAAHNASDDVPRVWTSLNDGAGSGLDADTLDGHNSSEFFGLVNTTGAALRAALDAETAARSAADDDLHGSLAREKAERQQADADEAAARAAADDALRADLAAEAAARADGDDVLSGRIVDLESRVPDIAWSTVLARDGAGSTLDADLLDGLNSTAFAPALHAHDEYLTEPEGASLFLGLTAKATDADELDGLDSTAFSRSTHLHDDRYYVRGEAVGDADTLDGLDGVDFARAAHLHDDRYFTETESDGRYLGVGAKAADAQLLDGLDSTAFSPTTHLHDNRYFTETESDGRYLGKTAKAADADLLDGVDSSAFSRTTHLHDDRYFRKAELQNAGTVNNASNPVDWTKLKGVPTGFTDGVDDGETYAAGAGLALDGTTNTFSVADGGVGTAKLADAGVTSAKVAAGAVGVAHLSFDPATQGELDAHKGSADHDGRYFTETESDARYLGRTAKAADADKLDGLDSTAFSPASHVHDTIYFRKAELQATGTINDAANPVDWTRLKGVPAGFADGTDDGATYSAGAGLALDGANAFSVADAGVTAAKLAAGAVGTGHLSFDPATQGELDLHKTSSDHDGRYFTEAESDARYLGKAAKAADADLLDGLDSTAFSRTGHVHDDRYFTEAESDGRYLGKTAKAADADRLDGLDSGSFLRSDVSGTLTGTLTTTGNVVANGGVYASNWLRSQGTTGWYSEAYGGGWHMTDSSWIRAYNGKNVYTPGEMQAGTMRATSNLVSTGFLTANGARVGADNSAVYVGGNRAGCFLYLNDDSCMYDPQNGWVYLTNQAVTNYGNLRVGNFQATGTKSFVQEHPEDPAAKLLYYSLESPSSDVYWRGTGTLVDGRAVVTLPEEFRVLASGELTVTVTPHGDTRGLFVPRDTLSASGFEVRESQGGASSSGFDYVVFAKRLGLESAPTQEAFSMSEKVLMSMRLTDAEKRELAPLVPVVDTDVDPLVKAAFLKAVHAGDVAGARVILAALPAPAPADGGSASDAQPTEGPSTSP